MEIKKFNNIEYSIVSFKNLYGDMRIDSDYYDPYYIRNESKLEQKNTMQVKDFMSTPQYGISIAMNEDNIGYKMLKMDDILDVFANDETAKSADITENQFKKFELKKFDVLFNRVNSDEYVGRTGIYLLDGKHTFASFLVRITSEKTYQNCYLTIFLNSKYGKNVLQRVKRRAVNQANINAQELNDLKVPYPSIIFQKEIEKLVLKAYELKSNSTNLFKSATNLLLKELNLMDWKISQSFFDIDGIKMQTDESINIISLTEILSRDRFDSEYWQKYLDNLESNVKGYSNGWSYLSDICNIYDSNFLPDEKPSYRYIELSNIGLFGNIVGHTEDLGINLPTRARRKVIKGQLIVSSIEGSLESCAMITDTYDGAICSNGFYVIDSEVINSETLIVMLKSLPFQNLLKKGCTGTILTAINPRYFGNIVIPKIHISIQNEIKKEINSMYEQQELADKIIEAAKFATELYIEKEEKTGLDYLNKKKKEFEW